MKWYRSLTTRVLGWRDVDSRDARRLSAPAAEAQRRLDSVLLGALLDPLVDVAEDLLVASSPVGEVHVGDHHGPLRYPPRLTRSNPGYRLSTLRPKLACATGRGGGLGDRRHDPLVFFTCGAGAARRAL